MKKNNKSNKACKSIIENLTALKAEAAKTRTGEAKAIDAIIHSLSC